MGISEVIPRAERIGVNTFVNWTEIQAFMIFVEKVVYFL